MALSSMKSVGNYRMRPGRPDLRGWPVHAEGGTRIGTVRDLLVDELGDQIRYLDVALEDRNDSVLVPVGHARVDRDGSRILLPGLQREAVQEIPGWAGRTEELDSGYERRVGEAWDAKYDEVYYRRPEFQADPDESGGSGKLGRLNELRDFQVAEGESDPTGWKVVGPSGVEIGEVDHLIGDTGILKVRYFVIDLDVGTKTGNHHILVPAGYLTLDREKKEVLLEGLHTTGLQELPRYPGGAVEREEEERVTRAWRDALGDEERYRHPRYRESSFWGEPGHPQDPSE